MKNPVDQFDNGTIAVWITMGLGVIATWWKARLQVRRDRRDDGESELAHAGYRELISDLRADIRRLREELQNEIVARQAAERRAAELASAMEELELKCDTLERTLTKH